MNKIRRNSSTFFKNLAIGTIFEYDGSFFIKIDVKNISSGIDFIKCEGKCIFDMATIPDAIDLSDGSAAYFPLNTEIVASYPSITICLD